MGVVAVSTPSESQNACKTNGKIFPATTMDAVAGGTPTQREPKCCKKYWESIDYEQNAPANTMDAVANSTRSESQNGCKTNRKIFLATTMDAVAGSTPSESQNVCKTYEKALILKQRRPSNHDGRGRRQHPQ